MTPPCYCVAYPHPSLRPSEIVQLCEVPNLPTTKRKLLEELVELFPELSSDLRDRETTVWTAAELPYTDEDKFREEVYQWVSEKESKGTEVRPIDPLERLFPDGPKEPLGEWVHIVVVTPEVMERLEYQGGDDGNLRRMKDRLEFSRTLGGTFSPSESVKTTTAIKATVTSGTGPRYGRPSDRYGPPTSLFDKSLARLKYDLEHLDELTPPSAMILPAFNLITTATDFFDDEVTRGDVLRGNLTELLGANFDRPVRIGGWGEFLRQSSIEGWGAKQDGVWFKGRFACVILALKNEPGLDGDPFLQSLAAYGSVIAQQEYSKFIKRTNLPVVLLTMAGNCLTVSAAVYTNAVYADKLLSIDLYLGAHGSDNVVRLARIFTAINNCTNQLSTLYSKLETETHPRVDPSVMYPNPTADPPDAEVPQVRFFGKVDRAEGIMVSTIDQDNENHGIYLATYDSRTVLVKFAPRYNEEAHRLLASHGLAPTLHHCIRVIGDMYMVVMEYLSDARPLPFFFPPFHVPRLPDIPLIRESLTKALELLHGKGLVFGDLRVLNILYSPEYNRIYLVDFDWTGKDGVDRYSACANPEVGIGIGKWEILRKNHDDVNFERIMKSLDWQSRQ